MNQIKQKYEKEAVPALRKMFGYKNAMEIPKLSKVVVNVGIGAALKDKKLRDRIEHDIAVITGQKPSPRLSGKSIAGFKIRQGMAVGLMATLRGKRMYDFLDRLINIALPRMRDFRGLDTSVVDQCGNANIGLREQIVFPEVQYQSSQDVFGFQVTIVTTAKNKEVGETLLRHIGLPLKT